MSTRHEAIVAGLVAALSGHTSDVLREEELPQRCPAAGLLNVVPQDAVEEDVQLGTGRREWSRQFQLEVVVQAAEQANRITALDTALTQIGVLLHQNTLGGLVDFLLIGPPGDVDTIPMEGAASLKGAIVVITVFYQTSDNPMEIQT